MTATEKTLEEEQLGFFELLEQWNAERSVGSEDVIAAIMPLLTQVHACHAEGKVSPVFMPDRVAADRGHLWFAATEAMPARRSNAVLRRKSPDQRRSVKVVEHLSVVSDDDGTKVADKSVSDDAEDAAPRYLTSYRSWEVEADHHDPLTDIFGLGMLMGSLATGLDFRERDQLETFVRYRADLAALNGRLHPVVCRAIERMTALERYDRAQDLGGLITALDNHRSIGSDFDADMSLDVGDKGNPRQELLKRLRARLYDLTRRNRLVYHKAAAGELNLTEASVPLVINIDAIKERDLFTAKASVMKRLLDGKDITLGDYVRFEEMRFAPSVLSKLRADAARDQREFGSSPLRLVPIFLRWYDLKNAPSTPISSPLLLMRVELKRRKGVRDAFTLRLESTKAAVNPALAFVLEKLYGIRLPAEVDLAEKDALENFHALLEKQIMASEPGVTLDYADRPKMRMLHQKVRRRLDQFNRRRQSHARARKTKSGMNFSYDRPGFNPLGIQLFRDFVAPAIAPRRELTGRPLPRRFNQFSMAATAELEGNVLQKVDDTGSRFEWGFDLCSVTLANFNYRKMTLVRDYDALISGDMAANEAFDHLFGDNPRPSESVPKLPKPEHRYPVVAMDPTQESSVLRSRTGQSYVIQGPPGTGKSQTISNLIADFIGQGKMVLFVCEKRAALDVVDNRLKGIGLGSMCALVHDSQENKRDFIKELEQIYNHWSDAPPEFTESQIEEKRKAEITRIDTALADVRMLVDTMQDKAIGSETVLYDVLQRALGIDVPDCPDHQRPLIPELSVWSEHGDAVRRATAGLRRIAGQDILARCAERLIAPQMWRSDALATELPALLERIGPRMSQLAGASDHAYAAAGPITIGAALAQIALAARLAPAAEVGQLGVFAPDTAEAKAYRGALRLLTDKKQKLEDAQSRTTDWKQKLTAAETDTALALAQAKEGKFLSFLSGDWRRLKAEILTRVDLSGKAIKPTLVALLTELKAEHDAAQAVTDKAREIALQFGFDDYETLENLLAEFEAGATAEGLSADPLRQGVTDDPSGAEARVTALARLASVAQGIQNEISGKMAGLETVPINEAEAQLASLAANASALRDLQPLMAPLADAPQSLWAALAALDHTPDALEALAVEEAVRRSLGRVPGLANIDADMLQNARDTIAKARAALQTLNAQLLETRAINRFREHVALSNSDARSNEAKQAKSRYLQARRALEHEFGKTRAYRSPREMLAGPAGAMLPDLKPIWLMSPLSVADVLPLDTDLFDVVIFDEASQIPVEDAVPTLVRAEQIIVVGDDKQLPPTNFFAARKDDDDFDEDDEDKDFELSQDSFLALSAEKLNATMLGWHYRSRSEELIGFSNAAFYSGRLLTIPSTTLLKSQPAIHVSAPDTLPLPIADALARPISFHLLENAVYSDRRNADEAVYIAHLVRDLLAEGPGKSIGIVAFSEAQQGEIDAALSRLADDDAAFAERLEIEREREEDGEFIGLFVKNLENVQGDERDIILLSICYGPDHGGKMRMNFGPINKLGGEKRLNVIFSRAKENMMVISTITSERIKNDYNAGANALKTFLRYAEALSQGDEAAATRALSAVSSRLEREAPATSALRDHVAGQIRARGYEVRQELGLSDFVIDFALRRPGDETYKLAVLIDTSERYRGTAGLRETFTARASLLEVFGWKVLTVPLKDWWGGPEAVLDQIDRAMPD